MLSKIEKFFDKKKFVIILAEQITPRDLAYTGALIGLQFGRKVPEMVGRDQMVPASQGEEKNEQEGLPLKRTHMGITTQMLPVLNGLDSANMRVIRERLIAEKSLVLTEITDAAATSPSYQDYAQALAAKPLQATNYWGFGVFGDEDIIKRCTQGLSLYNKQPKVHNSIVKKEVRLVDNASADHANLPTIKMVLANDLMGGILANSAVILGVSYGKLYGDRIFGPDLRDHAGNVVLGLPRVSLEIMHGHTIKNVKMRTFREALHQQPNVEVVDVTDAAKTRSYEDYLALSENTSVLNTNYRGIGISGANDLVTSLTEQFSLYVTSAEEKALLKKEESAKKEAARKWEKAKASAPVKNNVKPVVVESQPPSALSKLESENAAAAAKVLARAEGARRALEMGVPKEEVEETYIGIAVDEASAEINEKMAEVTKLLAETKLLLWNKRIDPQRNDASTPDDEMKAGMK